MNTKITLFIIISLILVIPSASAQEINIGEKAVQKSVEVVINDDNEIHVKHIVSSSNSPKQMKLIDGIIENLTITDEEGKEQLLTVIGDNYAVMVFPSSDNSIIEYDLKDVLLLKNNVWTLDFLYLETTTFIIPEKLDLIFVNDRPVYFDDKKGFSCHGCQMILEYSIDEPKILKNIKFENNEFLIEVRTFAEIDKFNFDQSTKNISFHVNGENQLVTILIPVELASESYNVFIGDEKIKLHNYVNNGTHVWLNIRPDSSGDVSIVNIANIANEKPIIQTDIPETSVSDVNQDIVVYVLLGVIVIVGLVVMMIIMRKKKSLRTSVIEDNNI
ncbi:MAG: hypothetical protein HQ505_06460 [Nitrosopumilus sp.]|nr:hypothetical protein [Nitrosopumilus sp.]